ncbi:hypothetical protein ES703_95495 [subsurface metagenome]
MALFTTTPARLMTPIPVIMMPKGEPQTSKPISAPMSERTTVVMMMSGTIRELNWITSTRVTRRMAMANALLKKARDSSSVSFSPA